MYEVIAWVCLGVLTLIFSFVRLRFSLFMFICSVLILIGTIVAGFKHNLTWQQTSLSWIVGILLAISITFFFFYESEEVNDDNNRKL